MKKKLVTAGTVAALAVMPALALGAIYQGHGTDDPVADVKIRVERIQGKRYVTRFVADQLHYAGGNCSSSGRTDLLAIRGEFRVQANGEFAGAGNATPDGNPADSGELRIRGDVTRRKVTGLVRFTFGKDGCRTDGTEYRARRR